MAGRKSDFTLPTNTLDELFSSQEERDEAKLSKIRDIPLEEIDDFPDHPFQVREDEDMFQLVESIKERGVIREKVDTRLRLYTKDNKGKEISQYEYNRNSKSDENLRRFHGSIPSESPYSQRKCLWIFRSERSGKIHNDENVSRFDAADRRKLSY